MCALHLGMWIISSENCFFNDILCSLQVLRLQEWRWIFSSGHRTFSYSLWHAFGESRLRGGEKH